jgi:hypothetical protein
MFQKITNGIARHRWSLLVFSLILLICPAAFAVVIFNSGEEFYHANLFIRAEGPQIVISANSHEYLPLDGMKNSRWNCRHGNDSSHCRLIFQPMEGAPAALQQSLRNERAFRGIRLHRVWSESEIGDSDNIWGFGELMEVFAQIRSEEEKLGEFGSLLKIKDREGRTLFHCFRGGFWSGQCRI